MPDEVSSTGAEAARPLSALHRRLGAGWIEIGGGTSVPADYGDPEAEYGALREACGLVDRSWIGALELRGEDRQRFLHGLVTCEVKGLEPGRGSYGFFTNTKGRLVADVVIRADAEIHLLELPAVALAEVAAHAQKYIIADRVEVEARPVLVPVTLAGPEAPAVLARAASIEPLPEPWSHCPAEVAGVTARLAADGRWDLPAWTLWCPEAAAPAVAEALLEAGGDAVRPVGHRAVDLLRIERGIPWFGRDFGADELPQETGLEADAVSYEKGCYLGQEVVARLHFLGQASRSVRRLRFPGGEVPAPGTTLSLDGKEVARVTSSARPPGGEPLGIGMVRRAALEAGTRLEGTDGLRAEVVGPPFVDAGSR